MNVLKQTTMKDFKRYRGQMSSITVEWATPKKLFDEFNDEFGFTLDSAATPQNAKCARFYTKEQNSLSLPWDGRVWCNPPYGPGMGKWTEKGYLEFVQGRAEVVVFLVPARTDTIWWHEYALKAQEIRFCKGRIGFDSGKPSMRATFPSVAIVFRRDP